MVYRLHSMRDLPKFPAPSEVDLIDPLSDLLSLLRARCLLTASLETSGDWAMRFGAHEAGTLKFSAVVRGQCWLQVEGVAGPAAILQAGDCVLFNGPPGYTLASDLALPPVAASAVFASAPEHRARHGAAMADGADGDTQLIGGQVCFEAGGAALLLGDLPPVIVVQHGSAPAAIVQWVLQRLADEVAHAQIGGASVRAHLAHLLFVQMLRAHLADRQPLPADGGGWLGAVAHPRIGSALQLMHAQPARRWTLDELAAAASMSRSTFSARFRTMVGRAPIDYLLYWRMQRAMHDLRNGNGTVAAIAIDTGYESESAFSNAFKRIAGQSPAHYRRQWRLRPETLAERH